MPVTSAMNLVRVKWLGHEYFIEMNHHERPKSRAVLGAAKGRRKKREKTHADTLNSWTLYGLGAILLRGDSTAPHDGVTSEVGSESLARQSGIAGVTP